jgi:hypothetical protein
MFSLGKVNVSFEGKSDNHVLGCYYSRRTRMAQTGSTSRRIHWTIIVVLAVISLVSIGLFAYASMNPQTVTVVSTSYAMTTSFVTSTQTSTSYSTVASLTTITAPLGSPYAQTCAYTGYCSYSSDVSASPCLSPGQGNAAFCSGVLFQAPNGCLELVIPVYSGFGGVTYQYYTLYNLPRSYPAIGSWVTVTGQLHRGFNGPSTYGAACPGNYLNVTSIA